MYTVSNEDDCFVLLIVSLFLLYPASIADAYTVHLNVHIFYIQISVAHNS